MLTSRLKVAGAAPIQRGVFIPIILSNATNSFLFLIGTDAQILGRIQLPSRVTSGEATYHRYGNLLYVFISSSTNIFRCNLTTLTSYTISSSSTNYRAYWVRFSSNTLLQIETAAQKYKILNMQTGVITTTSYTSTTIATTGAGGRGSVSFYDRSSSGLSNFGSRVYWQGTATTDSPYSGETNTATVSSGTLNARTIVLPSSPNNYSRGWSAIGNSSTGFLGSGFGGPWKVSGASQSATAWALSSDFITYNGNNFGIVNDGESPSFLPRYMTSSLQMYQSFYYYNPGLAIYNFIIGKYDFSAASGTQTASFVMTLPTVGNTTSSTTIIQTNNSGYVAILYQVSSTVLSLNIVNGTTIVSSTNINISSSYSTIVSTIQSSAVSELELYEA